MNISKVTNNLKRVRLLQTIAGAYEITLNKNKEILSKIILEKSNRVMQSDLAEKMRIARRYFTLEMSPPSNHELKILRQDIDLVWKFIEQQSYTHLTVKQAFLLFLVCTEVGLWFFMGETIGKMHFVGYKV
ncbi:PREDICTED: ATP synthase subunit g, mitochondrial-like [Papilio polytes]|uniref:ATP synthase subunit g, mitochondrial-like n=1 Tax=Papilio polytes TaxID=76194 RepID=UPI0006761FC9|nr:PREDICTED: ATP synthase subunit g, mitochondrial-like [Papilio polytes]